MNFMTEKKTKAMDPAVEVIFFSRSYRIDNML